MQLESYPIRTDLALESQERLQKDNGQVKGVRLEEEKKDNGVVISTVFIDTENAAKAMGRPRGTYVTIEAPEMIEEESGYHRHMSVELAQILRQMVAQYESKVSDDLKEGMDVSVLIAGLGNREVTPDALGPKVVDNLFITRHIMNEFGKYAFSDEKTSKISGIVPGVMAQTGMESVAILRGIVKETEPDSRLFEYLFESIQLLELSDKGVANFHLVFLLRLLHYLGIYPNVESYVAGSCFDMLNGVFVDRIPMHRHYLNRQESVVLARLLKISFENMSLYSFSRQDRVSVINRILEYYRLHLPDFPEIKSLSVMQSLFD